MSSGTILGSDDVTIDVTTSPSHVTITYRPPGPLERSHEIFLALATHRDIGTAVLPFRQGVEGSTVFLPFQADLLLSSQSREGKIASTMRRWDSWRWSERQPTDEIGVRAEGTAVIFRLPCSFIEKAALDFLIYTKNLAANDG